MTATDTLLVALLAIAMIAIAVAAWFVLRRRELRQRFGAEYDRAVASSHSRREADRELLDREKRHGELTLNPLSAPARATYARKWRDVQAQFVTDPPSAIAAGDDLVTRLVAERGYPTTDYEEQLAFLSVEHARPLSHYRDAHDIFVTSRSGAATTEDLRRALVHYREIFADLLDESPETIVDASDGGEPRAEALTDDAPRRSS